MIKFFRKIRQNLLTEGKTAKYLKYAIGEIVLVVIGILIALQINNWNEERKDRIREQAILKSLRIDFEANLGNVNMAYDNFLLAYNSSVDLLDIIKSNNDVNGEVIIELLDDIINMPQSLDLNTGAIDEIVNTGSKNLIRDSELRKQLSKWSFYLTDAEDDIVIYKDYLFGSFISSLTNKVLLRNLEEPVFFEDDLNLRKILKSNFKIDYQNTIRTVEFENEVYNNALNYMYALNSYKVFTNYLSNTLELIEQNIDD